MNIPQSIHFNRKIALRVGLVVIYIALILFFFISGRTHTVLIDNKADPDGAWKAIRGMGVSINGGEAVEYLSGDRDITKVKGQKIKLHIEFFDGTESTEYTIKIPFLEDTVLLSIPKLLNGVEPALEPFNLYADNKAQTDAEEGERFGQ